MFFAEEGGSGVEGVGGSATTLAIGVVIRCLSKSAMLLFNYSRNVCGEFSHKSRFSRSRRCR
jgi:hypothetical protein